MAILLKNDILQVSGNILGNYITNRPPKHEITSTNFTSQTAVAVWKH